MVLIAYSLIVTTYAQVKRYREYKTITQETRIIHDNIDFPAVTICNDCLIRNDSLTDARERKLLYNLLYDPNTTAILSDLGQDYVNNVSLRKLFSDGAMGIKKNVLFCYYENVVKNCSEVLTESVTANGLCYTFNAKVVTTPITTAITGAEYGLQMLLWTSQENYYYSEAAKAGFKVSYTDLYSCYVILLILL